MNTRRPGRGWTWPPWRAARADNGNGNPASLRSYLLGYDLDADAARKLSRRQEAMLDAAQPRRS